MKTDKYEDLLSTLKERFEKNMVRHKGLTWEAVLAKLEAGSEKLKVLAEMDITGGEPDVISYDKKTGEFVFCDCSTENAGCAARFFAMTKRVWIRERKTSLRGMQSMRRH